MQQIIKYSFPKGNVIIFESALFRTTSTLIENDHFLLLVDPTWLPEEIDIIKNYVDDLKGEKAFFLLFTHSDYDHIIAYQAFPGAKIIVSKDFENNPDKALQIEKILTFDAENYITRNYPISYPKGDIVIEKDEQVLAIGDISLHFYLAPGHNLDGIFTIIAPLGIFIAGDYLSNIEFPFISHSSIEYEKSIDKITYILKKHPINLLITGHGDATIDTKEIIMRQKDAYEYINKLKSSLTLNIPFDIDTLSKQYKFSRGMINSHNENISMVRKELGI